MRASKGNLYQGRGGGGEEDNVEQEFRITIMITRKKTMQSKAKHKDRKR